MASYVVQGAKLKCTFGSQESTFQVPVDHKIYINNKPQGNMMDFKPMMNIMPFGLCSSLANPTVAAATAAASGVLQKMPCIPATVTPWFNVKMDVLLEYFPAMLDSSKTMCMWCGMISITDNGQ